MSPHPKPRYGPLPLPHTTAPILGALALPHHPYEEEMCMFLLPDVFSVLECFVVQPRTESFPAPIFCKDLIR